MVRFPIYILLFPIVFNLLVISTGLSLAELESKVLFSWKTSMKASNLDSWLLDTDNETSHCRWAGVQCDNDGSVIEINLSNFSLNGTLDELNFLSLPYLTHLNLSLNNLQGKIPKSIGNLLKLNVLDLGINMFTGSVSVEIGNLTELHSISLRSNNLSGPIPYLLGQLKKGDMTILTSSYLGTTPKAGALALKLGHCAITEKHKKKKNSNAGSKNGILELRGNFGKIKKGSIPHDIGLISGLKTLDLRGKEFLGGPISASLGQLRELEHLVLN
ncbi:probable leucine-rich repeat receptor-like protein kinase At1g35710 isoform X2 [Amborella trichopoda]|uniref:probable leucine-rich repeat receptor-like protein kinase At1g35710 isoform X2 n=1 Tax=Amborella trichopoda TaxID=13333 RepID=UPI0009BE2E19|nr:probable leucine-rich repeat receptor-like protein kinase At1g35710 isoform X2 [Amborella trichopoda]|eukprot:XP_020530395.1 probable leucine-rich repeat receptor-like protein kinase At1g35710 isoform X2 [Amborella trichopoda]